MIKMLPADGALNRVVDIYSETNGLICKDNWKLKNGVSYEYDAFGRRVTSADYSILNGKKQWLFETNQNFLYDGLSFNLLAEFYDTEFKDHGHHWGWNNNYPKHNPISEYVYGNGKIIERTDFGKSDKWSGNSHWFKYADKTYYAQDILGSTILLTGSHGQTIEEYVYDAFGNSFEGTFLKRNEIGYNGKIFDPVVRLYDYGYRDYAPVIGRWITVDPIRDGGNWYEFCRNNPIFFQDIVGLLPAIGARLPNGDTVAQSYPTLSPVQTPVPNTVLESTPYLSNTTTNIYAVQSPIPTPAANTEPELTPSPTPSQEEIDYYNALLYFMPEKHKQKKLFVREV